MSVWFVDAKLRVATLVVCALALLALAAPAGAAGVLKVEIVNGYNLVVDSNVTSPATYSPGAAYIGARICNTGDAPLQNVFAHTGDYKGGVGSTPGIFPVLDSTGYLASPQITNTGSYSLTLESGDAPVTAEGSRYVGTLAPGECRTVYWLISYPHCVNVNGAAQAPPCDASITGGVHPGDDVSLNYDVWATTTTAIAAPAVSSRRDFTMRNEISASANKIWPNTTSKVPDAYLAAIQALIGWGTLGPDGQPLSSSNPVYPGQRVITTQGIWYDLGNVGAGFDNDGDLVPDQNAWLQPVGDAAAFAPDCFRLVNVYGILIVKLKSGGELLVPFQNQLYFERLPDNTGVVGLVYYQFVATEQGCSANMTPYQEAASGFDNEKFSADFGLSNGLVSGTFGATFPFTKTDGVASTTTGSTLTYTATGTNNTGVNLGAPDLGTPLVVNETIPAGTTYVVGSADDSPNTNLTEPTGTGTYTQSYTDIDGNVDSCSIGYSVSSSSWLVLYSTNSGATWTTTEPASGVTNIQWLLTTTIALDGSHNGNDCVAPNGLYDNGTLQTSLPPGKAVSVRFQVTVNATGGPVVCNTAGLGFGSSGRAQTAQDCTIVQGNNTLSGNVFKDDGTGVGAIYGNGTKDGTEAGIGAGVVVTLYYDVNGNGVVDTGEPSYATTTTSAAGAYSFTNLADGPYLVVVKKYDGATADGVNNAATDAAFATNGWGSTTSDPNLPLTTNQGILELNEDVTTTTLAVNIDLARSNALAQSLTNVNFGFAPPLRVTKTVAGNPDLNADGRADTAVDEGELFSYVINVENRLPSVGRQGPTGCQYTAWATTGTNGSPASKAFTDPAYAWDGPNRLVASTTVEGGGLRYIEGTGYTLRTQAGNITKVEALYLGYFSAVLTDDTIGLTIGQGVTGWTQTFNTALIDSYVGEPASLDPNSAISWDVTALRPGGGTWSWADNFSTLRLQVNPSKASSADQKTFSIDAMGIRVTTDQPCEAGTSTTLSPVPLQDSYDAGTMAFVSASPMPDSINTATGVLQWNDVGPILPGGTASVTVTMRPYNRTGVLVGTCGASSPPALNSACNWAETAFSTKSVLYSDGRAANDGSSKIAVSIQGKGEIRGTLWRDTNADGWPNNDGEPAIPSVAVTLWGCVQSNGVTMETSSVNKTCEAATGGNFWKNMGTAVTTTSGAYEFIGLDTGYYLVEVGNTDGVPGTGNASPYGGTQTAEASDTQAVTAGSANGTAGVCAGGCNNTWGNPAANLNALNLLNSPAAEEIIGGVNFGYNIPNAVLYGNVWWDVNGNATLNVGDAGLSGFTVQRYFDPNGDGNIADGTLQATTTTDASGNYSFSGLPAGSYVIVVVPPSLLNKAWVETVESTGGTTSLNNQIPITVTVGQISGSHDFGYTKADTSSIGDSVYFDFNANGIQDATEAGIPNITVWLYNDVDRDGGIDAGVDELLATTSTNGAGNYLFSSLPSGSYIVKVDTADADFPTDVTPTADPDVNAASIGDSVFLDSNNNAVQNVGENGIARVVVNLYSDSDGSGTLNASDSLVASTTTDTNGNYLFTRLGAGRYFVDIDETTLPTSALSLTTTDPASTLITLASSAVTEAYVLADAGYSPSTNFAIGNRIWHDVDNDGVQDPGEPGIPNVDVVVTNGTGTGCAAGCRASTDASGFWIVTGLTIGTFTVNVDDADVDFPRDFTVSTGTTDPRIVTVAGADLANVDFGYRYTGAGPTPTGTITGRIFRDADGDLAYDLGEARSGTTANLLDADGNVVATTTSAADGTYSFNGVFIGNYTLQAVDKLGTRFSTVFLAAAQTFPNLNVIYRSTTESTPDSQSSVSIDGVRANLLQDFGYQRFLASIGDSVYWDVNENATQDGGEPGFAGVTVRLYDAVWSDTNNDGLFQSGEGTRTLIATTSTVADDASTPANEGGTYLFSNLSALASGHRYLVEVVTTTLPGTSRTLIADPDTDGFPCTLLPNPDLASDDFPPPSVCDSQQLIFGFLPGNNYLGADFGYRINGTGYATIGDQLWIDTDGDGTRDDGEVGVPNISVWLDSDNDSVLDWTDGNANGAWDSGEGERWTATDTEGFYAFTSVTDGTYNVKVLTTDVDWPSGLATLPTFEVRASNGTSRNNAVQVVVSGGAVTSVVDGDPANDPDTCTNCNLNVDFGYRYAGTNALSGTICVDDSTKNGYCGATALTYSGVGTGEASLEGVVVSAYRWTDDGDNTAWTLAGVLDSGDAFQLIGSTSSNATGDYSFSNLPDNVVIVFSVSETQNLRLTTTNANSSVEDANVIKRQLYEGTTTYEGNTVTIIGRQALNIGGDTNDTIQDLDYAFDATLGGLIAYDFGDLPAGYSNTLLANSGAQHRVTASSIYLGSGVTTETDGAPSADATADANDTGVTMVSTVFGMGGGAYVDVVSSAAGWVAGWIDFNGDGDFDDTDEMILDQAVNAGTNNLFFYVPTTIPEGMTDFFSRFRVYPTRPQIVASTGPALDSTFQRMNGEVEDYLFVMAVAPTAVEMLTMDATQGKSHATITWSTSSEVDNLGFHVYRQLAGGAREKLNKHIITGSAFMTGRKSDGPRSYRFVDRNAPSGFVQYFIEDVDLDGTREMHGPISPRATSEAEPPVTTEPDPTLGSVGGIFTTAPGMGVTVPAPAAPTQAQLAEQWTLAGVPAVKVIVTQPGWYSVRKSQLIAAGFDPGENGRVISVFTEGTEVPVLVNAKNEAKFDVNDSIEFFGRAIDTTSTGGRVYYITSRKGSGLRVKSVGGKGNSGSAAPASFPYTFERIERTVFFAALTNNGDRENFFGPVVTTWPVQQSITVVNRDSAGNAKLELVLQGGSDNMQHVVAVDLNGRRIGTVRFRNLTRHVATLNVSPSALVNGENTLTLTAENGWEDVSTLESLRLVYPHVFRADNDALTFTVSGGSKASVSGFTTAAIRVLDVTDPMAPVFIDGDIVKAADGSNAVSLSTTGSGTRTLFAFADTRVLAPAQIAWNEASTWNATTNGANLVIISNRAFLTAANALKAARDAQGISTMVVDVQNVYDEFSYGHHSPKAIRDFLARTQFWKTKPHYAILLGDSSFDPRNYLGFGSYDFVPTKLVATTFIKTASDDWFADFDNTGVASMAIGRIPARTAEQAMAIVQKLIARGNAPTEAWAKSLEVIADHPDGYPFERAANRLAAAVPAGFTVNRVSIASTPSPANAIVDGFNRGALLTTYIGHGSVEMWSHGYFTSGTASALTNTTRLPFVVAMNCLNGYFHDLFTDSLAEALLRNANGGAIGVWASSALSGPNGQLAAAAELNRQLLGATPISLGDAILQAKRATSDPDVRKTWILFGDPTLKLR